MSAIGGHERPGQGATNDWLTPRWILDALGPFDLDPCASESDPVRCAPRAITWRDDGLRAPWDGFVWVNPPYGPHAGRWLMRLADHAPGGIALVFARTETRMMSPALARASLVLFLAGRLKFVRPNGETARANAGAPSMLVGYGDEAARRLRTCEIAGVRMIAA